VKLRDEVETVLRSWHAYEVARGGDGIIDYDCYPASGPVPAAADRLEVLDRLTELAVEAESQLQSALATRSESEPGSDQSGADQSDSSQTASAAQEAGEPEVAQVVARIQADLAYLRALLGERLPLADYVEQTQGCRAIGWSDDYLARRRDVARQSLAKIGVQWGDDTALAMREAEEPLLPSEAAETISSVAAALEPHVRSLADTAAPYALTVETVDIDAYWAYWLDGSGTRARLRLNLRQLRFTRVRAQQFALHEVLGLALQSASFAHRAASEEVPWVRIMSMHAPQQVLLEGVSQALPLFVAPGAEVLTARVRLDHYLQMVRARLHLAINAGVPVQRCAAVARALVPFWNGGEISDALADRSAKPLLRSYLWAFPAGMDWFVNLAEHDDPEVIQRVMRAAYREPLTPTGLAALWPDGPSIGGG